MSTVYGSFAGEVSQTLTSYTTQDTHATELDTDFDCGDGASVEASLHETECSLAHRTTPAEVNVSSQAHADLVLEACRIRESLTQTQSELEAVQTRLQVLEAQQPRLEGQLDVLIRMMHPAAPGTNASSYTWLRYRYGFSMPT